MKKVLFSLFVLAGFAACTSDDVVISDSTTKTFDGDEAYFTVNIRYADQASTRATSSGYEAGTEDEYAIARASFYFYDEAGEFVSRAEIDNLQGTTQTPVQTTTGTDGNSTVEFQSDAVVVLKGLTDTSMPRYMVTVINEPAGFEGGTYSEFYDPAGTLNEFLAKLAYGTGYDNGGTYNSSYSFNQNAGIIDADNYFVMSTTSFVGEEGMRAGQDPYYFVTGVTDEDFYEEPITAGAATPIDVYVERLAAKVTMAAQGGTEPFTINNGDGTTTEAQGYLVTATIAGEGNEGEESSDSGFVVGDTGDLLYAEGDEDIYIVLDGWKLNATARQSYISKNIDTATWSTWDDWTTGSWNDALNHRSYWGEAYLYGKQGDTTVTTEEGYYHNGYPESAVNEDNTYPTATDDSGEYIDANQAGNYDADEIDQSTWLNSYVKYTSLNAATNGGNNTIGTDYTNWEDADYEYCAENTNTTDILYNYRSSAITSALVKATGYTKNYVADDTTGEYSWDGTYSANTLISYNGMLFTEDAFEQKVTEDVTEYVDTWASDFIYDAFIGQDTDYGEISYTNLYYSTPGTNESRFTGNYEATSTSGKTVTIRTTGIGGTTFTLTKVIASDDFTWQSDGNGHVSIAYADSDYAEGDWLWYEHEEQGTTYYTLIRDSYNEQTGDELAAVIASINDNYLATLNEDDDIYAYVDGQMYYSVPIEHLNNDIVRDGQGKQTNDLEEAQYGIVRNHEYRILINDVTKLGYPISDENEVIIPDPSERTYWYVEAEVNVLGWKIVNQTTDF